MAVSKTNSLPGQLGHVKAKEISIFMVKNLLLRVLLFDHLSNLNRQQKEMLGDDNNQCNSVFKDVIRVHPDCENLKNLFCRSCSMLSATSSREHDQKYKKYIKPGKFNGWASDE